MTARAVLTAEQRATLLARLREGASIADAAKAIGLSRTVIWQRVSEDRALRTAVDEAREEVRQARAETARARKAKAERERRAARPKPAKVAPPAAPQEVDRRGAYAPDALREAVSSAASAAKAVLEASVKGARRVPAPPTWASLRPLVHAMVEVADRDALVCLVLAEVEERAKHERALDWRPTVPHPGRAGGMH